MDATEIGSLFLDPAYRGRGRGRLLSLTRFVFIARHPKRFADQVIAEMRGRGERRWHFARSGKPSVDSFLIWSFPKADSLSTIDKRFIEDLMPHHPIYVCLLPPAGREVIGRVHPDTEPALAMLREEGFSVVDMIDIFDGGPVVQCARDDIAAVRRVIELPVIEIAEQLDAPRINFGQPTRWFPGHDWSCSGKPIPASSSPTWSP